MSVFKKLNLSKSLTKNYFVGSKATTKLLKPPLPSYKSLLDSSLNSIGNKEFLIQELSLKKILTKNQQMKNIIFKMAQVAVNDFEEDKQQHPFLYTAGEVFFGGDEENDILTPGILILLLNRLVNSNSKHHYDSHLQLAKGLVETTAGYQIHRTIQETSDNPMTYDSNKTMHQGNKLATLTGDLLVVSLIKNVAKTGNNKVLELIMTSLSEFSSTEMRSIRPFDPISNEALLPSNLAESSIFSTGFESSIILSNQPNLRNWASELGSILGLLWKTNFDGKKLKIIGNQKELDIYLNNLSETADQLLSKQFGDRNQFCNSLRNLVAYWGRQF